MKGGKLPGWLRTKYVPRLRWEAWVSEILSNLMQLS